MEKRVMTFLDLLKSEIRRLSLDELVAAFHKSGVSLNDAYKNPNASSIKVVEVLNEANSRINTLRKFSSWNAITHINCIKNALASLKKQLGKLVVFLTSGYEAYEPLRNDAGFVKAKNAYLPSILQAYQGLCALEALLSHPDFSPVRYNTLAILSAAVEGRRKTVGVITAEKICALEFGAYKPDTVFHLVMQLRDASYRINVEGREVITKVDQEFVWGFYHVDSTPAPMMTEATSVKEVMVEAAKTSSPSLFDRFVDMVVSFFKDVAKSVAGSSPSHRGSVSGSSISRETEMMGITRKKRESLRHTDAAKEIKGALFNDSVNDSGTALFDVDSQTASPRSRRSSTAKIMAVTPPAAPTFGTRRFIKHPPMLPSIPVAAPRLSAIAEPGTPGSTLAVASPGGF